MQLTRNPFLFLIMYKIFDNDFIIPNNEKEYLSDILTKYHYEEWFKKKHITVLNKTHCGNGGTTGIVEYCLNEFCGALILVPNRSISISKEIQYRSNDEVCCVYGGCDHINKNATVVIATYDQFGRLIKELSESGMDINNRFWSGRNIVIDEYHKLVDESNFRKICFQLTELIKNTENGVLLMSATPHRGYVEMLRKYCCEKEKENKINTYTIDYGDDSKVQKGLMFFETKKKDIKSIIQKVKKNNKQTCVFYSSVKDIKNILNVIGDDDVEVLCSEVNQKELGEYYSSEFNENKKLHFMTSAYFTGHDINVRINQCIIVGSPISENLCYSDRDIKQMIGRFRKGVYGINLFYIWSNFEKNGYTEIKSELEEKQDVLDALGDNWILKTATVKIKQEVLNLQDIMERFEIWKDKNSVKNMLNKIFGKVYDGKIGDFEEVNKSKKLTFRKAKEKVMMGEDINFNDYQYSGILKEYFNVFGKKLENASLRTIRDWYKIYRIDNDYQNIVEMKPQERYDVVFGDGIYKGSYIMSALNYVGVNCSWEEVSQYMMSEFNCYCLLEKIDRNENRNNDEFILINCVDCWVFGTSLYIRNNDFSVPKTQQSTKISYNIEIEKSNKIGGTFDLSFISEKFNSLSNIPLYQWINEDKKNRLPLRKKDKSWRDIKTFRQSMISELYRDTDKKYRHQICYLDRIDNLIIDLDEGIKFSEFKEKYGDYSWTAYPTISNITEDWTKFRVIIPLKQTLILKGKNNLKVLKILRRYFCNYEDSAHNLFSSVNKENWSERYENNGELFNIPQEVVDYLMIVMENLQNFTYRKKFVNSEDLNRNYMSVETAYKIIKDVYDSKIDNVMHWKTFYVKKRMNPDDYNDFRDMLFSLNRSVVTHWDSHRINF